jgi:hypothetical protein
VEAAELVVASTGTEHKALITDVSLSGEMSGVELAQYAKRKFPHINVVRYPVARRLTFRKMLRFY